MFKSNRVCIVLTGASQGFGATLGKQLAQHFNDQILSCQGDDSRMSKGESDLMFILISRNMDKMQKVKDDIHQLASSIDQVTTHLIQCDLSKSDSNHVIGAYLDENKVITSHYDHCILIHNAGSLGDPNRLCRQITSVDSEKAQQYYRLNLYSVMELTAFFLKRIVPQLALYVDIINISSLAASSPLKGLIDYCMSKAAREAYFRSLAQELEDEKEIFTPTFRVLNYAPGPLETEMLNKIRNDSIHLGPLFKSLAALTTEESALKLIKILRKNNFENGQHVDYYDVK